LDVMGIVFGQQNAFKIAHSWLAWDRGRVK